MQGNPRMPLPQMAQNRPQMMQNQQPMNPNIQGLQSPMGGQTLIGQQTQQPQNVVPPPPPYPEPPPPYPGQSSISGQPQVRVKSFLSFQFSFRCEFSCFPFSISKNNISIPTINENLFFDFFKTACFQLIVCYLLCSRVCPKSEQICCQKFYDYPLKSKLENTIQQHLKMRRPTLLQVRLFLPIYAVH